MTRASLSSPTDSFALDKLVSTTYGTSSKRLNPIGLPKGSCSNGTVYRSSPQDATMSKDGLSDSILRVRSPPTRRSTQSSRIDSMSGRLLKFVGKSIPNKRILCSGGNHEREVFILSTGYGNARRRADNASAAALDGASEEDQDRQYTQMRGRRLHEHDCPASQAVGQGSGQAGRKRPGLPRYTPGRLVGDRHRDHRARGR